MKVRYLNVLLLSAIAFSLCSLLAAAHADVTLPSLFSDNMVLQRNAPVPVFGTADPGERVTVSVAGKTAATVAGADGHWRVTLNNLPDRRPRHADRHRPQHRDDP